MIIDVNPVVGNPYKDLLRLPEAERELELACVTVGMIEEYEPIPLPFEPEEFRQMMQIVHTEEFQKKKAEVKERFYRKQYTKPAIKDFVVERDKVVADNYSNYMWLKRCLKYLPEQDFISRRKVENVLETFRF
jgi:thiamine pyrophosphate-dependent acetolactate synthase large subunit-like protein